MPVAVMVKRERKNLSCLYGMRPVPDDIYEMIMRADSGVADESEFRILDQYIKEKKHEIRRKKMEIGSEGSGPRRGPGKLAENNLFDLTELVKLIREDEDCDE